MLARVLKVLVWSVAGLCVALASAFGAYDVLAFQPRREQIAALIQRANTAERVPLEPLAHLMLVASHGNTAVYTSRLLIDELHVPWVARGQRGWDVTSMLWYRLVRLHLSREEQLAIVFSKGLILPRVQGFAAGSRVVFDKPLEELNRQQVAELVVRNGNPGKFTRPGNQQALVIARDRLLDRARERRAK